MSAPEWVLNLAPINNKALRCSKIYYKTISSFSGLFIYQVTKSQLLVSIIRIQSVNLILFSSF